MPSDTTVERRLTNQLEKSIVRSFYRSDSQAVRDRAHKIGLQSPLWLWTHQAPDNNPDKDLAKAAHLVLWALRNSVEPSHIAVVLPGSWKSNFKNRLLLELKNSGLVEEGEAHLPVVLGHHELPAMCKRDGVAYTYELVLYVLGAPAVKEALKDSNMQTEFMEAALAAATGGFVLSVDVGWTAPAFTVHWPDWSGVVKKMRDERPFLSGTDSAERHRLPSMASANLPLCCAKHFSQRQLSQGLETVASACSHLCLHPYGCGIGEHLCRERCHPNRRHPSCPYACNAIMPCGHRCLVTCASRCNCYEVVERPLPCSHEVVLGLDAETLQPIYATVRHIFKGVCADAKLPCAVEYTTECARCLGPVRVRCFEAQQQQHTRDSPTIVCSACRRAEREMRAQLLGEILHGAEREKKRVRVELKRASHTQHKAAAQGIFFPGAKVEIIDAAKCVPPLLAEDDFPGVVFADMDDPNFFQSVEGAYGTFLSSHVDVMDRSEVRNLVRLPDGQHVLVTDGGLRMIRVLTNHVAERAGATLLLTARNESGSSVPSQSGTGAEFASARAAVGSVFYLPQPVPCAEVEAGVLTDKLVRVTAIDPNDASSVLVECVLYSAAVPATSTADGDVEGNDEAEKRVSTVSAALHPVKCHFSAPLAVLEPLTGLEKGKYIFATAPQRQITDPHSLQLLNLLLATGAAGSLPGASLTSAPLDPDTAYELVALINPPYGCATARCVGGDGYGGPCALVRVRTARHCTTRKPQRSRRGGIAVTVSAGGGKTASASAATRTSTVLAAIPFLFTAADEMAEAEAALDAAALKEFERRLQESINGRSKEVSMRNDEEAFHLQQKMGSVTAEMVAAQRTEFSVPLPLPSQREIAEAKTRYMNLPNASSTASRMLRMKEALAAKQEPLQVSKFLQEAEEKFNIGMRADSEYLKTLAVKHVRR